MSEETLKQEIQRLRQEVREKDRLLREKEAKILEMRKFIGQGLVGYLKDFPRRSRVQGELWASLKIARLLMRFNKWAGNRLGVYFQYSPRELDLPDLRLLSGQVETPMPSLAVVTPSYNQARYLERTIRSVVDQGYPSLSYAVMDGGSTDGSQQVIERHKDKLASWVSEQDKGQADAVAKGFRAVDGDVMGYLNSDDFLAPGCLHLVGQYFAAHPEVDVVYGCRVIVDENDMEVGRWIMPPHSYRELRYVDYVPQETMFWRKRVWDKIGGIDTSFQFALDWDLLLRFQDVGARIKRLPHFLACFRAHSAQKSSELIHTRGREEMLLLRKRTFGRNIPDIKIGLWNEICKTRAILTARAWEMGMKF